MIGNKRTRTKNKKTESFLSKLFDILSDANYNKIISWDKEGNKIIIFDVVKLCNEILPKFYKHRKYASFIRQLNLYGFRKSKGIEDNLEKYEHDKFNKNITKEQIKQITNSARHNNMVKNIDAFINNTKCDETLDTDFKNVPDDKVISYLTKKIDENMKNIIEAQKEIEKLKNEINGLNKELIECKSNINSNKKVISKLIKNSVNTNINDKKVDKINNIKDLFNRYLYQLKIYSPFVNYDSVKIINQKEKNKIEKNNNDKNIFPKFNRFNSELNNSRDIDDLSFLNETNNINFIDLNLMNINYSNSFINNRFCN